MHGSNITLLASELAPCNLVLRPGIIMIRLPCPTLTSDDLTLVFVRSLRSDGPLGALNLGPCALLDIISFTALVVEICHS